MTTPGGAGTAVLRSDLQSYTERCGRGSHLMGDQQALTLAVESQQPDLVAGPVERRREPERVVFGPADAQPDLAGQVGADHEHARRGAAGDQPVVAGPGEGKNGLAGPGRQVHGDAVAGPAVHGDLASEATALAVQPDPAGENARCDSYGSKAAGLRQLPDRRAPLVAAADRESQHRVGRGGHQRRTRRPSGERNQTKPGKVSRQHAAHRRVGCPAPVTRSICWPPPR